MSARIALALALALALGCVCLWANAQHKQIIALRADVAHHKEEASTARRIAAQAQHARNVALTTLTEEQARNREYDAVLAAIQENDNEAPIDPAIAAALRGLCARDPNCDQTGGARGGR